MTAPDVTVVGSEFRVRLNRLVAHPDNPRAGLGDLTELVRSIKAHGVLAPLPVLPADKLGIHRIVAGHRRHVAAVKAGCDDVPVLVRDLSESEVIEAMIVENENRNGLTVSEQIRVVERLMSLDAGLSPNKLCKRIGKSQAWVRTRMAVTVLPGPWRDLLDAGEFTLADAEAAATVADLGPEHIEAVCVRLREAPHWIEPAPTVENYRRELAHEANYTPAVDAARQEDGAVVFTMEDRPPDRAKPVEDVLRDPGLIRGHRRESCHALYVRRVSWNDGVLATELCTDPKVHTPGRATGDEALVSDRTQPRSPDHVDDTAAKRKGGVARTAQVTEMFGRARGGPSRTELTTFALRALIGLVD